MGWAPVTSVAHTYVLRAGDNPQPGHQLTMLSIPCLLKKQTCQVPMPGLRKLRPLTRPQTPSVRFL